MNLIRKLLWYPSFQRDYHIYIYKIWTKKYQRQIHFRLRCQKKHPKNLSWLSLHVQHHAVVVMTPNLAAPGKDSGETVDSRGFFSNFVWCPNHVGSGLALCLWGAAPKKSRVPGCWLGGKNGFPPQKRRCIPHPAGTVQTLWLTRNCRDVSWKKWNKNARHAEFQGFIRCSNWASWIFPLNKHGSF